MRRLVFLLSALVVVLAACGGGHERAHGTAELVSSSRGVHAIVVERRAAAFRRAERLLRRYVPPAGARPVRNAPRELRHKASAYSVEAAGPHRFFRMSAPLAAVVAAVEAHRPAGFGARVEGESSSPPMRFVVITPTLKAIPSHFLTVNVLRKGGQTFLRVDANAVWVYPRSPSERVPARVRQIVIRTPNLLKRVTAPAQVRQIVRWFDALPIVPPGIAVPSCPVVEANVRFLFLDGSGNVLAKAVGPPGPAWICSEIEFSIHGRSLRPLVDRNFHVADSFVGRVQRLLGVRLVRHRL